MTKKILVIGLPTENSKVVQVDSAEDASSLFDFDIVLADVDSVLSHNCKKNCPSDEYLEVREHEFSPSKKLSDKLKKEAIFLFEKGGLLVCVMKPRRGIKYEYYYKGNNQYALLNNYDWIPIENLGRFVSGGSGSGIKVHKEANSFKDYLEMPETFWIAYFDDVERLGIQHQIIAVNEASKAVAVEFSLGKGSVLFLPYSKHPKAGDILMQCAIDFLKKSEETPPPNWINKIQVPNEECYSQQLGTLTKEISKLTKAHADLESKYRRETVVKKLLYEKNVALEEIVKQSFEEIGFTCTRKDDKDWIINSEMGQGILEVTGSEGTIDIQKLRQLLNYLLDEKKDSKDEKKAILVANHFAETLPQQRGDPFSKKVIEESKVHSICLLPTTELFQLICQLREGKIKAQDARKKIVETVGLFK